MVGRKVLKIIPPLFIRGGNKINNNIIMNENLFLLPLQNLNK